LRKANTRKFPVVECKRCRNRRKTLLVGQMICQTCHVKEPKTNCGVCGKQKRFVTDGAGVCPACVKRATQPVEIECAKCGRTKLLAKPGGEYCKPCQKKVNCGEGKCTGCGKVKQFILKKERLCNGCYMTRYAPRGLQKCLDTMSISNEYNLTLFRHLVGSIKCERVDEEDRRRFSEFGRFLQSHHFDGPLTWGNPRTTIRISGRTLRARARLSSPTRRTPVGSRERRNLGRLQEKDDTTRSHFVTGSGCRRGLDEIRSMAPHRTKKHA
jgi:hypothetical protein